jgi:hypothetical protein
MGVLLATGLIVGESLFGVVYAGLIYAADRAGMPNADAPLAVVKEFAWAAPIGIFLFVVTILGLYWKTRRDVLSAPLVDEPPTPHPRDMAPR